MSLLDSILADTIGIPFRAVTGNVDPWTLQVQKDALAADTVKALGPDATDSQIAVATAQAQSAVDSYLTSVDAHPDQAGVRLPGLGVVGSPAFLAKVEKIVYGLIAAGALVGVFYFSQRYGSILKQTFRKR